VIEAQLEAGRGSNGDRDCTNGTTLKVGNLHVAGTIGQDKERRAVTVRVSLSLLTRSTLQSCSFAVGNIPLPIILLVASSLYIHTSTFRLIPD